MSGSRVTSPMWLTHHWSDQYERCARVGPVHICRRCLVLYPVVFVVAVLATAVEPSTTVAVAAMWLLPLPMSLEWVAEERGLVEHAPRRQVAVTVLAAIGVGVALATHLQHPFAQDALAPMATHVTVCAVSSILARRHEQIAGGGAPDAGEPTPWEQEHERRESERLAGLNGLLASYETPLPYDNEAPRSE